LTLIATVSDGSKNFRHASPTVGAPVRVRIPRAIISRTTSSFAAPVVTSTHFSDATDTTRPGYGPGMPGVAAGTYRVTMRRRGTAGCG
jgi:hypothetical protein